MDTYLLLRNNKQSGPYSLQQLVSLGLKPYDLVWLEGRSAAWRYPSEVDGLKAFAPATEEQPYDRFYKKPEAKPQERPVEKHIQSKQESIATEEPFVLNSQERTIGKQTEKQIELPQEITLKEEATLLPAENKTTTTSRKVFVAMPENHIPKKQPQPALVKTPPIEKKPVINEEKTNESKPVYTRNESIAREQSFTRNEPIIPIAKEKPMAIKDEPLLEEKYTESLDDIKKRYAETYLNRKKRSKWTSTHTSVLQVFGGAILFCTLVVLAYKNFAGEDQPQSRTTLIQPDKRAINTGTVTTTTPVAPPIITETNKPSSKKAETKKEETTISNESLAINSEPERNGGVVNEMAAVEKKAVMPKLTEEKPEETKPKTRPVNINRLVSVRANNYKQRAFGGVMNLELTVNNDSKFELDKVTVELQYLKPSEQPIKTEIIVFNSIEANGSKTLKIPDYLRGVKVAYRLLDIESSQYDRQTVGL